VAKSVFQQARWVFQKWFNPGNRLRPGPNAENKKLPVQVTGDPQASESAHTTQPPSTEGFKGMFGW
jgi:hypothetical protein